MHADLTAAMEWPDVPARQFAKAYCERGVMKGRRGKRYEAVADFSAVIELPDARPEEFDASPEFAGTLELEIRWLLGRPARGDVGNFYI